MIKFSVVLLLSIFTFPTTLAQSTSSDANIIGRMTLVFLTARTTTKFQKNRCDNDEYWEDRVIHNYACTTCSKWLSSGCKRCYPKDEAEFQKFWNGGIVNELNPCISCSTFKTRKSQMELSSHFKDVVEKCLLNMSCYDSNLKFCKYSAFFYIIIVVIMVIIIVSCSCVICGSKKKRKSSTNLVENSRPLELNNRMDFRQNAPSQPGHGINLNNIGHATPIPQRNLEFSKPVQQNFAPYNPNPSGFNNNQIQNNPVPYGMNANVNGYQQNHGNNPNPGWNLNKGHGGNQQFMAKQGGNNWN